MPPHPPGLHIYLTLLFALRYFLKTFAFIALPWVSQSFLYGLSASALLGEQMGPAIGWPVLIVTTNTTGLIIGWKLLGEWNVAKEDTLRMIKCAVASSVLGLAIIAAGGFA
jgi:hypothetical protein